jgi:hypothetical protein
MISAESARSIEQDLLQKADVIGHYLRGLAGTDPEFAARVLREITDHLHGSLASVSQSPLPGRPPVLVASRPRAGDEVEEFILDNLATSPAELSVQEIFDRFNEAEIEIKRKTLVVRLHRMEHAGKLMSRAHGHYSLSEVELRQYQASRR